MKLHLFILTSILSFAHSELAQRAYIPLKNGATTPKGWLLTQLKLQADGLSGHLSQFWDDVMNSIWIGGRADGGLHERTPYWLNGIVPLAFLLKNAGVESLPGFKGIYKHRDYMNLHEGNMCKNGTDFYGHDIEPTGSMGKIVQDTQACKDLCQQTNACMAFVVDDCNPNAVRCWLKESVIPNFRQASCRCYGQVRPAPTPKPVNISAQAEKYVSYVLDHISDNGYIGPTQPHGGTDWWGPSNMLLALAQYAEAVPERFDEIAKVLLNHILFESSKLPTMPLASWAAERWQDQALTVAWLLDNAPQGKESELMQAAKLLHDQGVDWEQWFETFTGNAGGHNVNNAQGLKSSAVWYRFTQNETLHRLSLSRMKNLDDKYGLPTGMFNGDEILPNPATRNPSRGIELCGVVEAMFSYNVMFGVHGDVAFADRAERVAYNALPATWASPRGGDMWAHQYLQAINEINAIRANPHVWTHDGDASETYGLEPNYGCCTANFNQGWPKFANRLVYATHDGGAAVAVYAPAIAKLPDGSIVDIETDYPFEDSITVTLTATKAMPLYLRIPSWAQKSTINGKSFPAGQMAKLQAPSGTSTYKIRFSPEIRYQAWTNYDAKGQDSNSTIYSVHRGVLMYSMPVAGEYTVYAEHAFDSKDYEIKPKGNWAVALDLSSTPTFHQSGLSKGAAPFNHTNWPTYIEASVRSVPNWGMSLNSAAPPPGSPACANQNCGPKEMVQLVPHGGTDLRIGEMPLAYKQAP